MTQYTALSIRQPWAWLIVNGFKDIENRNWKTRFIGRALIHAGKTMTLNEYDQCFIFVTNVEHALGIKIPLPWFETLKAQCGGIVGQAEITGCVTESKSPWFVGDFGFEIKDAKPLLFVPYRGELGFFKVTL